MVRAYVDMLAKDDDNIEQLTYAVHKHAGLLLTGVHLLSYYIRDPQWVRFRLEGDQPAIQACYDWLASFGNELEYITDGPSVGFSEFGELKLLESIIDGLCRELGLSEIAEFLQESPDLYTLEALTRFQLAIKQLEALRAKQPTSTS